MTIIEPLTNTTPAQCDPHVRALLERTDQTLAYIDYTLAVAAIDQETAR